MKPVYEDATTRLYHCDHAALAAHLRATGEKVDAMIVDAPYSERTHKGHDGGAASANRPLKANGVRDTGRDRRSIAYDPWTPADAWRFVRAWDEGVTGWICSLTDDVLAATWRDALEESGKIQRARRLPDGRYAFAPLPFVSPGSRVRLTGDGPSSWSCWIVVARPRTAEFAAWGTLPGAYVFPPESMPVVGGKPLSLMRALVRDYSRPGDLVCDPCCGAGTTLLAAKLEGRRALGCDIDAAHVKLAVDRLSSTPVEPRKGTLALFGGDR